MAIEFQDTGMVSLGGSSINPRSVSEFQRGAGPNYAGDRAAQLARSLESLTGAYSALETSKIEKQDQQRDLYVSRIYAGFGAQATQDDINNVTSALHPKVRQRVTEDYMYRLGMDFATRAMEAMPRDAVMSAEAEIAFFDQVRKAALAQAGDDPLRAAGFIKAVESSIVQRQQNNSALRIAEWTTIMQEGVQTRAYQAGVSAASEAVLPALSSSITAVAQKYPEYPWLAAHLTRSAQLESSGGRNLYNGSMIGPFQFSPSTGKQYGLNDDLARLDFNLATDAAARLAIDAFNSLKGQLGRDPTPAELYLYHQQGAGGGPALLRNPDANVLDVLRPLYPSEEIAIRAVVDNGGSLDMTAGEFASKWLEKYGTVSVDPANPSLPAEAVNLRNQWFGIDSEYQETSSLRKAEIRDSAAAGIIQAAMDTQNENLLLAMPEELITPKIASDFRAARNYIESERTQNDAKKAKEDQDAEDQRIRDAQAEMLRRRANGENINPQELAKDANGRIDFTVLEAINRAASIPLVNPLASRREALAFTKTLRDALALRDYSMIPGLQMRGEEPTLGEIQDAIQFNPFINPEEKLQLMESVESELGMAEVLDDPLVQGRWTSNVEGFLEASLTAPGMAGMQEALDPALRSRVKQAYDNAIREYVVNKGGIPLDKTEMLDQAEQKAVAMIERALAGFKNGAGVQDNSATTTPTTTYKVGDTVTDSSGQSWKKIKDGPDSDKSNWEMIE